MLTAIPFHLAWLQGLHAPACAFAYVIQVGHVT